MKTIMLALAVALVGGLVFATGASAYDRNPITVAGLYADGWYQTTSNAEANLRYRYHGIRSAWCTGAIMYGDVADSSYVDSTFRAWDKLVCAGYTVSGKLYSMIYDQKGKGSNAWTIYRLKNVTLDSLVYG